MAGKFLEDKIGVAGPVADAPLPESVRGAVEVLREFGRRAAREGLVLSTCGNASCRLNDDSILISGSGTELGMLEDCGLSLVRLSDGSHLSGTRPSSEHPLHRYTYEQRPEARFLLHYQSRSATVLACMAHPPANLDLIPEIPAYVKAVAYVPYATPGSDELARSIGQAFADPLVNIVQMQNHGQVVLAQTPEAAIQKALFFELAAWMHLKNPELLRIPEKEASLLRAMQAV
ncbi:MAG: class II aldolase/adducin family protein [Spirochaetales bacterium]|nr:class II aldolase/adducin family protein [Spirochaetales bacterium]